MDESTTTEAVRPAPIGTKDALTEICKEGARRMLATALEAEVEEFVSQFASVMDADGRRVVRRNGYAKERKLQTGLGDVPVRAPRVRDDRKESDERVKFTSEILPPYLRRTKAIEELLPWLYLKGVSTGDFSEALAALLGPDAPGLSATQIVRLKTSWEAEYESWAKRSLAHKRYVYVWADGIYFNARLTGERSCILVVMGATSEGEKELLAIHDGVRESEISWKEVLLSMRERGMSVAPEIAVGDGALGFWKALRQVFPTTREQRCTVHKTANVLNKLPKSVQKDAKSRLHDIFLAPPRKDADHALGVFSELFGAKYAKAVACLEKDRDELLTFFDFPAEHWTHLRTTNPIESTFATVRLRTKRTKGSGSARACLAMVFKLALAAERRWRKLNSAQLLADVITGVQFKDGIKVAA
jgi:transposase-like protein